MYTHSFHLSFHYTVSIHFIFLEFSSKNQKMATLTITGLLKKVAGMFPSQRAISVSGKFDNAS